MLPEEHWKETFGTHEAQKHAAQLGMWIFLATEALLFTGLFVGYSVYRWSYPLAFHQASLHLKTNVALVQTVMLVTSSWLVSMGIYFSKKGRTLLTAGCLVLAILLGIGFAWIKLWEWSVHVGDGLMPGEWYNSDELTIRGASMFFTLYFLMTGLHLVHLGVGIVVLAVLAYRAAAGAYDAEYNVQVEVGGIYWHFVDVMWAFIFAALYLAN